jgi:uncharacterized protein (DUF58 family)
MEEVYIFTKESAAKQRRAASARVVKAMREGKPIPFEDAAQARGLVVRERENSIFSDAWLPMALLFSAIGLIGERNPAMLALGIGLFIIYVVGTWWKKSALLGVTYERSYDRTHAFPGEPINITLTISNQKPLPLTWLQFKDDLPVAPRDEGEIAVMASEMSGGYQLRHSFSLNSYERTRRNLTLHFPKRGFYTIGPVNYLSGDIFTLFTIEQEHAYHDTLVIYPKVWPLEALQLPAKEMFGEIQVRRSLFKDPIRTQGIRDYQPQDRFRDVHWKATARRGNLQTKVYEPTSGMTVVAFLNVATFEKHWMGFEPDLLERAISVTASIASYSAEQKWGIGVYANGSVPGSDQPIRVSPGHSPDQLMRILEGLAAVTEFATGSIEVLMHYESRRLPWAATLVLVTAVVTEEMMVSLVRLKEAGRRVVLISLAETPPPRNLRDIMVYHIPPTLPAFQKDVRSGSLTETSLNMVPTPEMAQAVEPEETGNVVSLDQEQATDG